MIGSFSVEERLRGLNLKDKRLSESVSVLSIWVGL